MADLKRCLRAAGAGRVDQSCATTTRTESVARIPIATPAPRQADANVGARSEWDRKWAGIDADPCLS
jgi:hypothetical protein